MTSPEIPTTPIGSPETSPVAPPTVPLEVLPPITPSAEAGGTPHTTVGDLPLSHLETVAVRVLTEAARIHADEARETEARRLVEEARRTKPPLTPEEQAAETAEGLRLADLQHEAWATQARGGARVRTEAARDAAEDAAVHAATAAARPGSRNVRRINERATDVQGQLDYRTATARGMRATESGDYERTPAHLQPRNKRQKWAKSWHANRLIRGYNQRLKAEDPTSEYTLNNNTTVRQAQKPAMYEARLQEDVAQWRRDNPESPVPDHATAVSTEHVPSATRGHDGPVPAVAHHNHGSSHEFMDGVQEAIDAARGNISGRKVRKMKRKARKADKLEDKSHKNIGGVEEMARGTDKRSQLLGTIAEDARNRARDAARKDAAKASAPKRPKRLKMPKLRGPKLKMPKLPRVLSRRSKAEPAEPVITEPVVIEPAEPVTPVEPAAEPVRSIFEPVPDPEADAELERLIADIDPHSKPAAEAEPAGEPEEPYVDEYHTIVFPPKEKAPDPEADAELERLIADIDPHSKPAAEAAKPKEGWLSPRELEELDKARRQVEEVESNRSWTDPAE